MYRENFFILYAGEIERGTSLQKAVEPNGWKVKIALELGQALAIHLFYFPDVVIIDDIGESELAALTCEHLLSIGAEPLLIWANDIDPEKWNLPAKQTVQILPQSTKIDEVVDTVTRLVNLARDLHFRRHQSRSDWRGRNAITSEVQHSCEF